MKYSLTFKSPIGLLKICEENGFITDIHCLKEQADNAVLQNTEVPTELLYEAYSQLNEYFKGDRRTFDLPIRYAGTPFQQQVWGELQNIPYGEVRNYQDITISIGNEKAFRAVGQANHKNPILIVVPCHRVIQKNGNIGGFTCGIEAKKYLLELEGAKLKGNRIM